MENSKIHIYCIPGMAASSQIFEYLEFPEDKFQLHFLDWVIPQKKETLADYALRMTKRVKHQNSILLGVSFGAVLVQEMAKHIQVSKIIIISSIKSKYELPKRMIFARYTKIHKLLPTGLVTNIELLSKYSFGEFIKKRLELYKKYIGMRDKYYLDWSIHQLIHWRQEKPLPNTIHIHGDKDGVFPVSNIKNYIAVKNGTHIAIINKYKWFNENLPKLIIQENS